MSNQSDKLCEFTCYFDKLPDPAVIVEILKDLSNELEPKPNYFTILDNMFKEKKARFSPQKLYDFLSNAQYDETFGLQLYTKIKGEDNRFPRSNIILSRISVGTPALYGLSVYTELKKCEKCEECIKSWIKIIANFIDIKYGFGNNRIKFNLDFDYGNRHLMYAEHPSNAYEIAASNIRYYRSNIDKFLQVTSGKMIMSVFRYNLLSKEICDHLLGLNDIGLRNHSGEIFKLSNDQVLWTIPNAADQHALFMLASKQNLVFDKGWFNLDDYVPTRNELGLP